MFWHKKKEIPEKSTTKENVIPKLQSSTIKAEQLYLQEKLPDKLALTEAHLAKCTFGPAVITTFVKVLKTQDPERVKDFRDAAKSLVKLRHPNIVNFIGLVNDESSPLIAVLEYCPGKTVLDHLNHNHIAPLSWPVRLRIGLECAQAMEYLHQNRMVYRFMCASNVILTDSDFSCKLTDFELTRPKKGDELPVRWMAPEVLKRCHFTPQSDVWAYGIFLMELFTAGKKPYSDLLDQEVVSKLTDGSLYRMEVLPHYPKQLQADIKQCWEETPEKRPSLQMLMKDIAKLMIPKK